MVTVGLCIFLEIQSRLEGVHLEGHRIAFRILKYLYWLGFQDRNAVGGKAMRNVGRWRMWGNLRRATIRFQGSEDVGEKTHGDAARPLYALIIVAGQRMRCGPVRWIQLVERPAIRRCPSP